MMTMRYWIVGGDYQDPDFRALVPGTEKMAGPFENERKARNEWMRLTYGPSGGATTRFSIATESVHGGAVLRRSRLQR